MSANTTHGPLHGVKCVGILTFQQGPLAFSMMADLGAEVIKIEQPVKGEAGRFTQPHPELSWRPYYETYNRGFRSLTLNYQHKDGLEILYKLIKDADIFGINLRPGVPERHGFGYEDLIKINPGIVYLSMSSYGPNGPNSQLPGMDIVAQAMGGISSAFGEEGSTPMTGRVAIADEVAGYLNFQAAIVGLYHKKMTGEGQKIETSLFGGQIRLMGQRMTVALMTGKEPPRVRARIGGGGTPLFAGSFKGSDGRSFVTQISGKENWERAMNATGFYNRLSEVGCSNLDDVANSEELTRVLVNTMSELFSTQTRKYWIDLFRGINIICAPLNTIVEASQEPDAVANNYVIEVDHPRWGKIKEVGYPWKFHKTPAKAGFAPELGEHNNEILEGLGYSVEDIKRFEQEGTI